MLPSSQGSSITGISDEVTGNEIADDALSDHINEYFSTIGSKLAEGCTPGIINTDPVPIIVDPLLFDRSLFTELEVVKVCKDINVSKSSSLPNIKSQVLKHAFLSNVSKITKIFNASLTKSVFPQAWKLSTIVPLPKVAQPKTATDLRPVALTPLPGKVLERLVCNRLQIWINNNNILSKSQHGFRKKKFIVSAIAQLLNDIYTHINNRTNPYVIFVDLKKAFDTISHEKMIGKLQAMGMDQLTLSWFTSYLTNRQQCVKLEKETSRVLPIAYGVPQGSILGPILFSLYINEIANIVDCSIVLYADDTVVYHEDLTVLQENLSKIVTWCNDNLLTINVKKSHWLKIKVCGEIVRPGGQQGNTFVINGKELQQVDLGTWEYLWMKT